MVRADEIDQEVWQRRFFGHLHTFIDMSDDYPGAFQLAQAFMRAAIVLVFNKKLRLNRFANIMVKRSRSHHERVSTDFAGSFFSQVGYL